ncbi:GH36-type glycosyl hydrolase domain-containing protein [Algoriphagus marinus]|uniref:GH36-type glycosyl hydrolase domain-containing protein n=1 Tax=Algoriphagus marinus TaxID=1925762 RepID=UPI00094BAF96|nr:glucoamylase family protein [Algoriphagus marinus]
MRLVSTAKEFISDMKTFFRPKTSSPNYQGEIQLNTELYSSEQMKQFGKALAETHQLSLNPSKDQLLKRLAENESILREVRKLLTDSIKHKHQISPAGEWLIDNFYLIEENIRSAKFNFPKKYSEELPQLSNGYPKGVTRVYDIIQQVISHGDGRIDIETLSNFVNAYQTVTNLKLGELWAIPIMLRLALIENLRLVASHVALDRVNSDLANHWARKMIKTSEKDPKNLILIIADMARSNPPMVDAFVAELVRKLRGRGPDLAMPLNWIEQQLAEIGMTSQELVNAEVQKQAAHQVSMSNNINSLRFLDAINWRDFVEKHSIVERILQEDIHGIYGAMDFATRDRYRHVVEDISRKSKLEEQEVARIAIQLAHQSATDSDEDQRTSHVGYYLIGSGFKELEKVTKTPVSLFQKFRYFLHKNGVFFYLASILLLTLAISGGIFMEVRTEIKSIWLLIFISILTLLSVSQLSISLVNYISTLLAKPHLLPRMDFSRKIPEDSRTLVVIPAMLSSLKELERLVESLEIRFLANRNENLHFGLLTDFTDSKEETLPRDKKLIESALAKITALNKKYKKENNELFFLFHRPRKWNGRQNTWMGYERKRGKLAQLNALLRGSSKECFSHIVADQSVFAEIKYVITLDADTQLPMGTAWKLIGTMAHPLNHAIYDEQKKRVTKGYGILQPRVSVSLPDITGSVYARMHGNEPGIDPYTRASSDVYQDLFQEGSFIGKGIYEVDVFRNVLDGKFAENTILSHDLLEGCYLRSGLVSDVQLFEKYPTRYDSDMKRYARWVRGDWQIFSWFLPFVPGPDGKWLKNPISALSRWKIFDNIRRSLVPISLIALLLLGWLLFQSSLIWTVVVTGIIIVPIIFTSLWNTIRKPKDVFLIYHIKNSIQSIADNSIKMLFGIICLPYEAYVNTVAISKTLWRKLISKRNLLEWDPSANHWTDNRTSLAASYASMWIAIVLPIIVLSYLAFFSPDKFAPAAPVAFLWLIAPFITWWASKPRVKKSVVLKEHQNIFLRKMARKTWRFFEHFVGPEDNWLPPDNYQEQPIEALAHRTSPTNIGVSLLANLTARDFGYITTSQLIERTSNTIGTMRKMERYRGHFYNWYNTETLEPLFPKYISTVDSGNLAGHLLVLRQGMLAISNQNIISSKLFEGLQDTLGVLLDSLEEKEKKILHPFEEELKTVSELDLSNPYEVKLGIAKLTKSFAAVYPYLNNDQESETYWWKQALKTQLQQFEKALQIFKPWELLKSAPSKFKYPTTLNQNLTLNELLIKALRLQEEINNHQNSDYSNEEKKWLELFQTALTTSVQFTQRLIASSQVLAQECKELADIYWGFLYNKSSKLLSIGYNVKERQADASYYDLLASEVRLGVFVGIAQGSLPEESWFALGRLLTNIMGEPILLSWSGSMFEYLMPLLVMPTYENTLLDQTSNAAVMCQINCHSKDGREGQTWGVSESGYNMISTESHYQYSAFGVPSLGLKRGLEEDFVIAPYASALALMVAPEKACKNLELLKKQGFEGRYGFYEAIDYTPSRLPRGQNHAIVYSFMAHHQGMSLLSLAYFLLDKPMQRLFEAEPQFRAALLLLQERIPKATTYFAHTTDIFSITPAPTASETRIIHTPDTPIPEVQLLSNGKYHVMVTNSGGGYSKWKDFAVTRWREDATRDNWGTFCYIRDLESNLFWSNTKQPTLRKGKKYETGFAHGHVDFRTSYNEIETHTEIVVSPEDDIEMRRFRISNHSSKSRTLEVTSYAEVVLAHAPSDIIQPAFSNLFVQTEILPKQHAIICTRRPRSAEERPPWMCHMMSMHGKLAEEISYETDRMKFIGRGNSIVNPQAMNDRGPLSGNQGAVLDPIVAIRYKIILEPAETVTLDMITGMAESQEICQRQISKYQDKYHKDRIFELAWTHSQVVLRQINASEGDAQLYARLANSILFANPAFRADPSILINNRRQQSGLWGYAISGDLPIILLKIERQANMQLVKQLIKAHAYWRMKGLIVDLVIWNENHGGYRQIFQNEIMALVPMELRDRPGGVFVRTIEQISNEDRILFQTVARLNISDSEGPLSDQVKRKAPTKLTIPYLNSPRNYRPVYSTVSKPEGLHFYNGTGGFSPDGREYVIIIDQKSKTPAPWVNVIANPSFGTVVSESGGSYTWTENAHELRLTPWNNDPVSDTPGEAYYLRDEESGHFWSTSLLPAGGESPYIVRHGFGYSTFEHVEDGIYSEMLVYVDLEAAVKFTVLKIRNQSRRKRKLSATGYIEWVLGDNRTKTAMHIRTESDVENSTLFAKNPYSMEFSNRVAFFDANGVRKTFTADRTEFIGRNGTLQKPNAMYRKRLSGKTGLGLDPCAAIQVPFELQVDEEREIIFTLGAGNTISNVKDLVQQFQGHEAALDSLQKVKNYWKNTLGKLQVETPDEAINVISNGWLTYQTLSSRLWGRSGFYQSGGAFGFRDQLQDVMSLLHVAPQLAREQILLCASRQFKEGDVQHWWHPPIGRGVRTRCSDDFLWLPFVTAHYISFTADSTILDQPISFLEGRKLNQHEESYYDLPVQSNDSLSLYDHCVLAIRNGFNYGEKGLPLMGAGDWNDGFDRVGIEGKGESVWMAFFLYDILLKFAEIARPHNDAQFADECEKQARQLKENIALHAWDGEWYKRAWFDDGTPLGSSKNTECVIDSISQSWSVLSEGGEASRSNVAMESAYKNLVQKDLGIIQLLEPPFDKSDLNPGYIKGYVPGIRENGGQYSHASIWLIMAFAKLGDNKRVWELLNMINPVNHGKTPEEIAIYKVEPYVIAADVYANKSHAGRGGWTWYTGSAGWMYRLIVESFLGLKREGNQLKITPCVPKEWKSFKIHYSYKSANYHITIIQKDGESGMTLTVDGAAQKDKVIILADDGAEHEVEVLFFTNSET